MMWNNTLAMVFTAALLLGLTNACADSKTIAPNTNSASVSKATLALETRMETPLNQKTSTGWLCTSADTNLMYLFLAKGAITGLSPHHQMGLELDPTKPTMKAQTRFLWSATSGDSLLLDSPDRQLQVRWTDIMETGSNTISAISSLHGKIACVLESAIRRGQG